MFYLPKRISRLKGLGLRVLVLGQIAWMAVIMGLGLVFSIVLGVYRNYIRSCGTVPVQGPAIQNGRLPGYPYPMASVNTGKFRF